MRSNTKVMLFAHICDPGRMTGAEKVLLFVSDILSRNYEVILVVPGPGKLMTEAEGQGITVVIHPYPLLWNLYQAVPAMHQDLSEQIASPDYRLLMTLLQTFRPDWVIVNTSVCALPAAAAKEMGIPVAWFIQEVIYPTVQRIEAVQIVNHYADWIIGVSESVLEPFNIPVTQHKTLLMPNSWDDTALHSETWEAHRSTLRLACGVKDEEILIGSVSAMLSPHKGIDHFIHMAGLLMLRHPQVKFLIVGSRELTDYIQECEELRRSTLDPSRIQFHSFKDRIEQLYPAFDMVVVPSLIAEGFGMTALEGLVFGKPVIAYASGGINEVLEGTGNGQFLVPQGDIHGLVQAVSHLISHPSRAESIRRHNRRAAFEVFGLEAFIQRFNGFLSKVDAVVQDLQSYYRSARLRHAEGTVLRGSSSYTVFLLENGYKRPFCSEAAMERYRFSGADVRVVHDSELQAYPTGMRISTEEPLEIFSPMNMLMQGSGTGVYLRRGDTLHPIPSQEALQATGMSSRIVHVSDAILARFRIGTLFTAMHPVQ